MDALVSFFKRFGYLFYIMDPREHLFKNINDVPDYYKEVTPVFVFVIILEQTILLFQRKQVLRLNDSIANICQGMLVELFKIPLKGVELLVYTWVYTNWRITTLPWDSVYTWVFCMVTTDFCFYWMHRATHQINFLWMFHEPHHSSEEFNLTVPLRISVFTSATFWFTYTPMALAVPPTVFLVHYQMNIIYQYWLHSELYQPTKLIDSIFVTPTHHRVHHGRNPKCIDKNFGSLLIIWDKMFGTFEKFPKEKIAYGLVHPLTSFNPIVVQANHLKVIWKRLSEMNTVKKKVTVLVKGPGWSPGAPWLGKIEAIPEPSADHKKYDPYLPLCMQFYVGLHMTVIVLGYLKLILNLSIFPFILVVYGSLYIVLSTIAIGMILDRSSFVPIMEVTRSLLYFLLDSQIAGPASEISSISRHFFKVNRVLFCSTFVFWISVFPNTFVLESVHSTDLPSENLYKDSNKQS